MTTDDSGFDNTFIKPVVYMSRETAKELWFHIYHRVIDPLRENVTINGREVLYDDRMKFGDMRLEESPNG